MLQKWLKAGYIDNHQRFPTEAGTPQGGIISPTAAILTLSGMQKMLEKAFPRTTLAGQRAKINLVVYADDFIITGSSKELLENEVKPLVQSFLAKRGLTLSAEKTRITHINEGFDFLGQNVRKYGGKLLIKPSKRNMAAFLNKVRGVIRNNKQAKQVDLIRKLNPIIRGWANYHRHVVAKALFDKVDHEIWRALWQWAIRRHPNKNRTWIKARYFPSIGTRSWVFNTRIEERPHNGRNKRLALILAADTPIRRHRKIQSAANPFDPAWDTYFEERHSYQMWDSLRGRKKLAWLWINQNKCCPICQQPLTINTPWIVHYLTPLSKGGKDSANNQVMLHRDCHQYVHQAGIDVVKPVPAKGL